MTGKLYYYDDDEEVEETPFEDLAEAIAKTRQEWRNAASEKASRHTKEIYEIEMDFFRRNQYLTNTGVKMSQREFEKWEDTITDEYKLAEKDINHGGMRLRDEAEIFQNMIAYYKKSDFNKTVEAQAGRFYVERDNELRLAIRKDGGEDAEKDLACLNGFYPVAIKHLENQYQTENDKNSAKDDELALEDDVIKHLNNLNRLARKYGTRAFTPRDFWTSDICNEKLQTPAISTVIHYDHNLVEEYLVLAFNDEIKKRQPKANLFSKYGLDW